VEGACRQWSIVDAVCVVFDDGVIARAVAPFQQQPKFCQINLDAELKNWTS
jgi:hypothetical protein